MELKGAVLKQLRIGLLGLGNIGTGTYKTLEMNRPHIEKTTGIDFQITKILEMNTDWDRGIYVDPTKYTQNPDDIFKSDEIDIVIELLGGVEPATSYMLDAMKNGKSVVTANKAAVAENFELLTETAIANNVQFKYEASVAGGIPIINAITNALAANEFQEIMGILNGTTNYILTKMTQEDRSYDDVLIEAQEKGFAESDPTADVEGIDVANKLSILISIVFGKRVHPNDIPTKGITKISKEDIENAEEGDCVIKLIASAFMADGELNYFVQPTLVNKQHPLADVNNEFNAVFLKGNAVDDLMFYGKGAGPLPTASAVLGDVIEIGKAIK